MDVAVVGAGPAGARAAGLLAEAGLRVVLLERGGPNRCKPCAGGMPEAVFARLGLDDDLAEGRPRGYRFVRLRGERVAGTLEWPGFSFVTVRRERFDEALRRQAARRGCEVRYHHRVSGWDGEAVRLRGPEGVEERLRARCYLWADGAGGVRPAGLGFRPRRFRSAGLGNFALAFSAQVEAVDGAPGGRDRSGRLPAREREAGPLEFFLDPERNPFGYFWRFPLRGGYNVGVGTVRPVKGWVDALRRTFRWWLEWAVPTPRYRVLWMRAGIIPLRPSGRLVRGVHLALGDAGGLANPLNGEGIQYALASAESAAEVVERALKTGRLHLLADYPGVLWRRWRFARLALAWAGLAGLLQCAREGRRSLYPALVRVSHLLSRLRRMWGCSTAS